MPQIALELGCALRGSPAAALGIESTVLPQPAVRAATELSHAELDELLEQMDQDNKVMCRSGVVYLI